MTGSVGYHLHRAGGSGGVGALLPEGIVGVEALGEVTPDPIFTEEQAVISGAARCRQLEFARGRTCARRALAALGHPATALPRGPDRGPVWPPGYIGSITHTVQYCLAVTARIGRWRGIGVDAEHETRLERDLQRRLLTDSERALLDALPPEFNWPLAAFSAKEALFKAWYPQTQRWLGFQDAEIGFQPALGTFEARILVDRPLFAGRELTRAGGRFLFLPDRVVTAIAL